MFSIHTNMGALVAYRNMGLHQAQVTKSLRRLSSGYRINSAADDAAGLAISEKMRAQIRGLKMASRNAQNAISMLQTAEGGLNEVHAMLQRMNELAVQSANGTYKNEVDRENLNKEFQALKDEIDRISSATNYNGIALLDGSGGGKKGDDSLTNLEISGSLSASLQPGGKMEGEGKVLIQKNGSGDAQYLLQINGETVRGVYDSVAGAVEFTLKDGSALSLNGIDENTVKSGTITRFTVDSDGTVQTKNMIAASQSDKQIFQIGANGTLDQRTGVHIGDMSSASLGNGEKNLRDIDILTRDNANEAIEVLKKAINQVSSERGTIGAQINRLEYTINNLETTAENLQAAESSIRDVDMAEEMMNYTKHSILLQAAQAMLAQANQMPNLILQMLRSL